MPVRKNLLVGDRVKGSEWDVLDATGQLSGGAEVGLYVLNSEIKALE